MYHPTAAARPANESLARVLAYAIDAAGKEHASHCGWRSSQRRPRRWRDGRPSGRPQRLQEAPSDSRSHAVHSPFGSTV